MAQRFTVQEFHDLIRSQALPALARVVVHLNIAPSFWRTRPEWVNDLIPNCDGPGDTPLDHYTADPAQVTCPECLHAMRETNN